MLWAVHASQPAVGNRDRYAFREYSMDLARGASDILHMFFHIGSVPKEGGHLTPRER